ncbi:MAG: DUF4159 domain-containing protein [Planctomycetales bacterium]|nr:DUF4159 domain-containing protein [Planctomycetales bacterium]
MHAQIVSRLLLGLGLAAFIPGPLAAQQDAATINAEQVNRAIDRGVAYLKRVQTPRGAWFELPAQGNGVTALCTLALLNAGVDVQDIVIERALHELRKEQREKTYATALSTMVFCAAEPKKDMVHIRRNVAWLEKTQSRDGESTGSWSYDSKNVPGDNSNAQFALLALYEAERAGVEVNSAVWQRALGYWTNCQNADGSWGYTKGMPGTGSMTCAGITSVVIAAGRLAEGAARVEGDSVICCGRTDHDAALQRGLDWLGRNFTASRNPGRNPLLRGGDPAWLYYYLYGAERVGRMTAQRFLGGHDWYREGAEVLLADQDPLSGLWKSPSRVEEHPHIGTALALLFLSKGRRPVVVGKLKWDRAEDWNHHPRDIAHLVEHAESLWQRDLTWQVIDSDAARTEDLQQSPVLFLSGSEAPQLSREAKARLREYIDRGGFLFACATCGGGQFDQGFRKLLSDVFPEPEYRLRLLPPDHAVWRAEQPIDPDHLRPLWGVDYGCRTSVVYCPEDLSCYWELGGGRDADAFPAKIKASVDAANAIGVNVLTYATGREPKYKELAPLQWTTDAEPKSTRGALQIARLLHSGGCNAAPGALANLLRQASQELSFPVITEESEVAITDPQLFRFHLAFMHGRSRFRLATDERKQLREYLERRGTLLADSVCASREFTDSFRDEMRKLLPSAKLERIPLSDPLFSKSYGGYDIRLVSRHQPASADGPLRSREQKVEPLLEGLRLGDRWAVIFSPYDMSCALEQHASIECHGYTRDDAAKIGLNVLLYSLHH